MAEARRRLRILLLLEGRDRPTSPVHGPRATLVGGARGAGGLLELELRLDAR
jgi:hypothetical protein